MKKKIIKPFYFDISSKERKKIINIFNKILASGNLILGNYTKKFEQMFANFLKVKYCISVNSGTSALQILLQYFIKGENQKIAVASNTNFASVASILYSGGSPVYLDICKKTFVPCYTKFVSTHQKEKFKGVLWVHIGGIITPDFFKILNYCKKNKIFLLEDCAHSHGSSFMGKQSGSCSSGGAFSFFPTKVMTTMEGGMISTNSKKVYKFALSMRNQGKRGGNYGGLHSDFGNSWRISEIAAYLGIVQLNKLKIMLKKRKLIYEIYANYFKKNNIFFCKTDHMNSASNYKMIVFAKNKIHKINLKKKLSLYGVICGGEVYETPCHKQPVFKRLNKKRLSLPVTEKFCPSHFCPPLTSGMSKEDAIYCAEKICHLYHKI